MKYMSGWGWVDYLACPLSLREEIVSVMTKEAEDLERMRNA